MGHWREDKVTTLQIEKLNGIKVRIDEILPYEFLWFVNYNFSF